ncbi:MAG: P1 family peptidase [Myxococcota bacterium]
MPDEAVERGRLRDLGIALGRYPAGRWNAITDVEGVRVGHATLVHGSGSLSIGGGPVRTGVTAVLPNAGIVYTDRLVGGAFILNGAGEMSGLVQVVEWGLVETPILLTNTLSVGTAAHATVSWMLDRFPGIGLEHDVMIPLVGECDDSFLNDIAGTHVAEEHVHEALDGAASGPVEEGSVGGGTGMVAFDLKSGIGTASRVLPGDEGGFTLGVLVMSNVGRLEDLRVDGLPVGDEIARHLPPGARRESIYGSIIAVVATDAPLTSHQIQRICKRVALGLGRVGSYAAHGSGEIILGFSTANVVPRAESPRVFRLEILNDRHIDPLYQAAIECTEEAVLNALCASGDMEGANGRVAPGLPLEVLRDLWRRRRG